MSPPRRMKYITTKSLNAFNVGRELGLLESANSIDNQVSLGRLSELVRIPIVQRESVFRCLFIPFGGMYRSVVDSASSKVKFLMQTTPISQNLGLGDEVGTPVGVRFMGEAIPVT